MGVVILKSIILGAQNGGKKEGYLCWNIFVVTVQLKKVGYQEEKRSLFFIYLLLFKFI